MNITPINCNRNQNQQTFGMNLSKVKDSLINDADIISDKAAHSLAILAKKNDGITMESICQNFPVFRSVYMCFSKTGFSDILKKEVPRKRLHKFLDKIIKNPSFLDNDFEKLKLAKNKKHLNELAADRVKDARIKLLETI